jgi:parvulin-like peptidyl-prolyl isomerase
MMKYISVIILLFGIPLIMGAGKTPVDGIVATVNGTPVTLYQVNQRVEILKQKYPDSKDLKKKAVDTIIDDDIIYEELKTMGASINEGDVDNAIEQMSEANGVSIDSLKSELKGKGIDFNAYKDEIKGEIARTKLVSYKFRNEITITDDDIQRYYLAHQKEFSKVKQADISHILIEVPPDSSAGQQKKLFETAGTVISKIKNGEAFSDAAVQYSDDKYTKKSGGYLGPVEEGSLYPVLNSAIFKAKPGDILGPIRTPVGYEIILVNGFKSSELLPLKDIKEKIRNDIFTAKIDSALKNWLLTKRQKTIITIYNELL